MVIVWVLISTISLISALIIQQELACGWSYWQVGGRLFFKNLSCFSPQNDYLKYPPCPSWEWKLGNVEIDITYHPDGDIRDSIGKEYNPIVFKLANFYLVIWS